MLLKSRDGKFPADSRGGGGLGFIFFFCFLFFVFFRNIAPATGRRRQAWIFGVSSFAYPIPIILHNVVESHHILTNSLVLDQGCPLPFCSRFELLLGGKLFGYRNRPHSDKLN